MAESTRLQPIEAEAVEALGETALWRILVEPYVPKYQGLIATDLADLEAAGRIVSKVGKVLQIGEFAYQSKTQAGLDLSLAKVRAQVGEYWLFEMYAGQEVHLRSGHILKVLTETDLLMRIHNPDLLKGYL